MSLVVATLLCFVVLLCLGTFKTLLAIVAMAALALISPFAFLGLLVILAAFYFIK